MGYYSRYSRWPKYVSVAARKAKAEKQIKSLKKKGKSLQPVVIEGRNIAKTFWGKAWCDNLEAYSDFENRLPRGKSYVRNGSVIDLEIQKGSIKAQVMGSSLYHVEITITPMDPEKWEALIKTCSGKIDSLIELLQGKFSKAVMELIIDPTNGLFPKPQEIQMSCSCPDYAGMCKHIAATLYGVGASLDTTPQNLFCLRHVDHNSLITSASTLSSLSQPQEAGLEENELASLFGIEMDTQEAQQPAPKKKRACTKLPKKPIPKQKRKSKPKNA